MKVQKLIFIFFILTFFQSCTDAEEFDNKKNYNIKVGEIITYYVSSNSCCRDCWLNKTSMTSIKLIEKKEVKKRPEDCDGCTSWVAYVFKGVKSGQDTIKHFTISPHDSCSLIDLPNMSIVTVTN